jgi:excisionase family DNA binding protein
MPHTKTHHSLDIPLCAKEAAEMLGCSYRVFLKLIDSGIITGWRNVPGGRWHFSRLEIQLYIETQKIKSKKESLRGVH